MSLGENLIFLFIKLLYIIIIIHIISTITYVKCLSTKINFCKFTNVLNIMCIFVNGINLRL